MTLIRVLAALPFIGILGGIVYANRVTPYVLGLPFIFAWLSFWVVAASAIMGIVYLLDPANRDVEPRR